MNKYKLIQTQTTQPRFHVIHSQDERDGLQWCQQVKMSSLNYVSLSLSPKGSPPPPPPPPPLCINKDSLPESFGQH